MLESQVQPLRGKSHHRAAKIVIAIVLAILVIIGILAAFALKDDNAGLAATPSANVLKTILTNAITGKESELSATELNQYLAYQFKQKNAGSSIYLSINSDNTVNAYTPVTVKGIHLGVTAAANVTFDSKKNLLVAVVKSVHIGRLGVPVTFALNFMKDKLPTGVKVDSDRITVDSSLLTIPVEGTNGTLKISDIQIKNQKILLQTTGMTDLVEEYLRKFGDQLQGFLK